MNDIAEEGAVRVRFKHFGADAGDGVRRPLCAPRKLRLQIVQDVDKVDCPHCRKVIDDMMVWKAEGEAQGE